MIQQMGPPPDPEHMISMLENPQFASTMNEALQNPQVIEQMIQGNPLLRGMGPQVRQAMQDPNFRRMMTDPAMMRQMSQMSRQFGFGGGGLGGAGSGAEAVPAPGVTDTTPATEGNTAAASGSVPPPTPVDPFAMFAGMAGGGPGAAAGSQNPFTALFQPGAFGHAQPTPASTTGSTQNANPLASGETAGASNPSSSPPPANNPFANLAQSPFFQNPALMQQMLNAIGGGGGGGGGGGAGSSSDASQPIPGFNPFSTIFGPGQQQQQPSPQPPDTRPPEERYEQQLRQLNDMGFYEFERNIEALRRTGGSVQGAVEYLLTHEEGRRW